MALSEYEKRRRAEEKERARAEREALKKEKMQAKEREEQRKKQEKDNIISSNRAIERKHNLLLSCLTQVHTLRIDAENAKKEFKQRCEVRKYKPKPFVNRTFIPSITHRSTANSIKWKFEKRWENDSTASKFLLSVLACTTIITVYKFTTGDIGDSIWGNVIWFAIIFILVGIGSFIGIAILGAIFHLIDKIIMKIRYNMAERKDTKIQKKEREESYARDKPVFDQEEEKRLAEHTAQQKELEREYENAEKKRIAFLKAADGGDVTSVADLCSTLFGLTPFDWANQCKIAFSVKSGTEIRLLLELPSRDDIIPTQAPSVSATGTTLNYRNIPDRERNTLYDQFVASFSLGNALLLFLTCPFLQKISLETCMRTVDDSTGKPTMQPLLRGDLITKDFSGFVFSNANPVEALKKMGATIDSITGKPTLKPKRITGYTQAGDAPGRADKRDADGIMPNLPRSNQQWLQTFIASRAQQYFGGSAF